MRPFSGDISLTTSCIFRPTQVVVPILAILAAIANLQDQGFDTLIVQPTHIAPAEEFHDLAAYVRGLASIRTMKPRWQPFKTIALGRPLLGAYSLHRAYADDIRLVAEALAEQGIPLEEQAVLMVMIGYFIGTRSAPPAAAAAPAGQFGEAPIVAAPDISSLSPERRRRSLWPTRTCVHPASFSIDAEISPVNAPASA